MEVWGRVVLQRLNLILPHVLIEQFTQLSVCRKWEVRKKKWDATKQKQEEKQKNQMDV